MEVGDPPTPVTRLMRSERRRLVPGSDDELSPRCGQQKKPGGRYFEGPSMARSCASHSALNCMKARGSAARNLLVRKSGVMSNSIVLRVSD
jgi:hypothetical protein